MSVKPMTYARAMKLLNMPTPWNDAILKLRLREKSKVNHPDKGGVHNRMVEINAAFACLKNMPEDARQAMFSLHKAKNKSRSESKRSRSKGAGKATHDLYKDLLGDKSEGFGGGNYEQPSDRERNTSRHGKYAWTSGGRIRFAVNRDYNAGYEPPPPPPPPKEEPKRYFEVGGQRYRSGVYGGIWTWLGPQHGEPLVWFEGYKGVIIPEYIEEGTRVTATTSDDEQSSTEEVVIVWNKERDPYDPDTPTDVSVGIPTHVIAHLRVRLRDAFHYDDRVLAISIMKQMSILGADMEYEIARLPGG